MIYRIINYNRITRVFLVGLNYKLIKLYHFLKKITSQRKENRFLFILCPPYCGSTLIHELISTSNNVSVNNNIATCEGQQLPELKSMMLDDPDRWDENKKYPWEKIKKIWMSYWDLTKPILMEKSPPNLVRTNQLEEWFSPSFYIIMVRDPYAHIEGLVRRNKISIEAATEFAVKCLKFQKNNVEILQNKVVFKYEEMVEDPELVRNKIVDLLPDLGDIYIKDKYKAHNYKKEVIGLTNLNQDKINKFSKNELKQINNILKLHEQTLGYFGYKLISAS